jgi:hypothetical protein
MDTFPKLPSFIKLEVPIIRHFEKDKTNYATALF